MWIVAYASLMDKELLKGKSHRLVIVRGWKRVFNKAASRAAWRQHAKDDEIAAANAVRSPGSYFNGVAYEISDEELDGLKQREKDYHTETADAYDPETNEKLAGCIIFVSNKEKVRDDIKPIKEYAEFCRKAAYSWGEDFGKEYDRTTFLADGTRIAR